MFNVRNRRRLELTNFAFRTCGLALNKQISCLPTCYTFISFDIFIYVSMHLLLCSIVPPFFATEMATLLDIFECIIKMATLKTTVDVLEEYMDYWPARIYLYHIEHFSGIYHRMHATLLPLLVDQEMVYILKSFV